MDLFHFSEDPTIERFVPVENLRRDDAPPLVWAIDDPHQHMYLFPRDCPRVLLWPLPTSDRDEIERWFGRSSARVIAHVEYGWLDRIRACDLYRYRMPAEAFEDLGDAGMWVSRDPVAPLEVTRVGDLFEALQGAGVELRIMDRLTPLQSLWEETTLHWSAIRMANAVDWEAAISPMPEGYRV